MSDLSKSKNGFLAGISLGVILVYASAFATFAGEAAPEGSPATGELHIDGNSVTKLTLEDGQNRRNQFSTHGPVLTLPAGKYRLFEVALEGGYTCRLYMEPEERRVTIAPGQPATLKIGAPLRQVVRVERRARSMILNYELCGRGGERYSPDSTSEDFEYG